MVDGWTEICAIFQNGLAPVGVFYGGFLNLVRDFGGQSFDWLVVVG